MKNSLIILLLISLFSCRKENKQQEVLSRQPHLVEYLESSTHYEEIKKVKHQLRNYIDISIKYNLANIRVLQRYDYRILEPVLINSSDSRILIVVAIKAAGEFFNNIDITWICGFKKGEDWYFFRKNESLLLQTIDTRTDDRELMSFSEIQQWAEEREFWGYLEYDRDIDEWKINDDFFKRYMDNWEYVQGLEVVRHGYDFSERPDSFWASRYMLFEESRQRKIELTKNEWSRQDNSYENGAITKVEYDEYLEIRSPSTDEDWEKVKGFQKVFRTDSILLRIQDELSGEIPNKLK